MSTQQAMDPLEIIKFLCKDVWNEIFGKQVDKPLAVFDLLRVDLF